MVWGNSQAVLLLAPNQQTGVGGIGRGQTTVLVTRGLKALADSPSDSVVFITNNTGRVAEASDDRAYDFAVPIANVILIKHCSLQPEYTEQPQGMAGFER